MPSLIKLHTSLKGAPAAVLLPLSGIPAALQHCLCATPLPHTFLCYYSSSSSSSSTYAHTALTVRHTPTSSCCLEAMYERKVKLRKQQKSLRRQCMQQAAPEHLLAFPEHADAHRTIFEHQPCFCCLVLARMCSKHPAAPVPCLYLCVPMHTSHMRILAMPARKYRTNVPSSAHAVTSCVASQAPQLHMIKHACLSYLVMRSSRHPSPI